MKFFVIVVTVILLFTQAYSKEVRIETNKEAGRYSLVWNGENYSGHELSTEVYFYVVLANEFYPIYKDSMINVRK